MHRQMTETLDELLAYTQREIHRLQEEIQGQQAFLHHIHQKHTTPRHVEAKEATIDTIKLFRRDLLCQQRIFRILLEKRKSSAKRLPA